MKLSFFALGCVAIGLAVTAQAQVTVGTDNSANCYPFSCFASEGETLYQQVYSSAAFPGTITFNSISFYANTQLPSSVGQLIDGATYTIDFSTTSSAVNGLTFPPSSNVGTDDQTFGTFTLGGAMPVVLTLTGSPFTYNPLNGNLLMEVTVDSLITPEPEMALFEADGSGAVTSRLYGSGLFYNSDSIGLVTTFGTSTVPEPGAYALLGSLGLTGAAFLRRRLAR